MDNGEEEVPGQGVCAIPSSICPGGTRTAARDSRQHWFWGITLEYRQPTGLGHGEFAIVIVDPTPHRFLIPRYMVLRSLSAIPGADRSDYETAGRTLGASPLTGRGPSPSHCSGLIGHRHHPLLARSLSGDR